MIKGKQNQNTSKNPQRPRTLQYRVVLPVCEQPTAKVNIQFEQSTSQMSVSLFSRCICYLGYFVRFPLNYSFTYSIGHWALSNACPYIMHYRQSQSKDYHGLLNYQTKQFNIHILQEYPKMPGNSNCNTKVTKNIYAIMKSYHGFFILIFFYL